MKPTKEQEEIIKDALDLKKLKINAAAGSGKTSTLVMVANALPKQSLYLAFNTAIAREASEKFPSHVECRTTHSLAYRSFGIGISHKLKRPTGGYKNVAGTPLEIALMFKIAPMIATNEAEDKNITPAMLGMLVRDTVKRFEQSSDPTLQNNHVPYRQLEKFFDNYNQRKEVLAKVIAVAEELWDERINPHSPVLATHGTYLKLFQLSKPKLDYEVIYVDELQDSSDVVIDIFLNQDHAKLVAVGDTFQAIYGWNGAVNAMEKLTFPQKMLTKSFRFGDKIAEVAKAVVQGKLDIKGNSEIPSTIGYVDQEAPHTIIFRTNSGLLSKAVELVRDGLDVSVEINTKDFIKVLESALALKKNNLKKVKHDTIIPYSTWYEFEEAGDHDAEVKKIAKIINEGKAPGFIDTLGQVKKREDAQVTLTTCHKSKGREWDNVILAEDFKDVSGDTKQEEINLLYVACTRAQQVLEINSALLTAIKVYRSGVGEISDTLDSLDWDDYDD